MSLYKNRDLDEILNQLKTGSFLIKRKASGEKYSRHFYLDRYETYVSYFQTEKCLSHPHRYYIQNIDEIRLGFQTLTFDGLLKQQAVDIEDEDLAFSIFYNNYHHELHLMANDTRTRDAWVICLRHLVDSYAHKRQQHIIRDTNWILSHLRFADKDKSNSISKDECEKLLNDSLNIDLSKERFENIFQNVDQNGEGVLNPDEFVDFFNILTRRTDLYEIMQKYVKNADEQTIDTICMNVDELLYFLQHVQNQRLVIYSPNKLEEEISIQPITKSDQIQELINDYEPNVKLQKLGLLSLDGFRNLMLSDGFALPKPWCVYRPYQDMTRPLSDYYINTSHNTYLFESQILGSSNPEAYNRVLRAGCRVMELDCHDGDDGSPVVTHGHTLVKPCSFESIIRLIEPNLFKISPYPVILTIENHCSPEQEKEIARILKEVLGNHLITEPLVTQNLSVLPSPNDLRYKVLIRSTKRPKLQVESQNLQNNEQEASLKTQDEIDDYDSSELFVSLENVPFQKEDRIKDEYFSYQSSSLSESQVKRFSRSDPISMLKQAEKRLLRMYPDGVRQDSSNPNPVDAWNFGIQMVALNYQNDDRLMELCYGKFLDNGSCGYVLKPNYLIHVGKSKFNPMNYLRKPSLLSKDTIEYPQRLSITIISGQFLSRSNRKSDDIPDPYVVVSTHGVPCDQQSQKTKFIENNGLNPIWNETFQFDIYFPQMCLIRFDVYDYDIFSRDDQIAYFCLPMTTMQTGYRHIHLRTKDHDPTYSTLFAYISIENQ